MSSSLTSLTLVVAVVVAVGTGLVFYRPRHLDLALPWVSSPKSAWARWLANWRGLSRGREFMDEAHYRYGKAGLPCIMPGPFGEQVMLPSSLVPWLLAQPDGLVDARTAHAETVSAEYTMLHEAISRVPLHEDIIRHQLKTQLPKLMPGVVDEVSAALKDLWDPSSTAARHQPGFFTVDPTTAFRTVIARVSNRLLVGLPLCRNPDFYDNAASYVSDIAAVGYGLRLVPAQLRPLVAKLATCINRYHYWRCSKHLAPLIDERLATWHSSDEAGRAAMPDDFLTWAIRDAHRNSYVPERTPYMLALRLLTVNFAVIHTSTMTATSLIMDLASSDPERRYIDRIRDEILAVLRDEGDSLDSPSWTRAKLARLELLDSALRESMRVSGFQGKVLTRKVVAPDGVDVPLPGVDSQGSADKKTFHLPFGTFVNLPGYSIHHDPALFDAPHDFRADRWLASGKSATTVDEAFLPWGLGRHACPGRWLAVDIVKLILAEVLLRYDVASIGPDGIRVDGGPGRGGEGLRRVWMADIGVPNPGGRVRLRRRAAVVEG